MKKNFLALGICTFALALGLVACDDSTSANGSSGDGNLVEDSCGYQIPNIDYGEFTDERDDQVYKTVTIGTQTWMAENLNYDPGNVSSMGSYAWSGCYGNESSNCTKYGRLYTWEVAMDKAGCGYGTYCNNSNEGTQGICPSGWHLPTKEEWQQLVKPMAYSVDDYTTYCYYNGAGVELKTVDGWSYYDYSSSTAGTNASGFSALPAGRRSGDGGFDDSGNYAYYPSLNYYSDRADLDHNDKRRAFSVRCLQD